MSQRGIQRERQVREIFEAQGWWVVRAAGSFGDADLVALRRTRHCGLGRYDHWGIEALLVEVKSTAAGPFHSFGPADRDALRSAAALAGAKPVLAFWPPRGELRFIPQDEWPT